MTFVQAEFLAFFAIVYSLYWGLAERRKQNMLLAVVSAIFYGWIHPWFLLLLYGSAVCDYLCGLGMKANPQNKGRYLIVSMCVNLGMLGYFKYVDFFITNVITAMSALGLETNMHTMGVFLPVGISFYTFQTMSYTIDIYRGQLEARSDFLDYVVFVSFFPQLVAGPVERASRLLPQFEADRVFVWDAMRTGLGLAMWGAFKKICIADTIAPYVDKVFILKDPAGPLIWVGALGFTIQILADFSGYTDIARGIARMLGIELIENFKNPYIATNPSDFWKRWHVSFSTWIRDYLYIPLGGSRGGALSRYKATFGAMLLSGLWHGASWTFVLWGAYHACLISVYRPVMKRIPDSIRNSSAGHVAAIALMFAFTVFGWLIFRETHFDRLVSHLSTNPFSASPDEWVAASALMAVCVLCAIPSCFKLAWEKQVTPRLEGSPWALPLQTTSWAVIAVCCFVFFRASTTDFIYFQF